MQPKEELKKINKIFDDASIHNLKEKK